MKLLLSRLLEWLLRFAISLRYTVEIKGLEKIYQEVGKEGRGVLFLPNHPAVFIDPAIVTLTILRRFKVRPVVVDFMYYLPGINFFMGLVNAVPIPNFSVSSNSHKVRKMNRALGQVIDGLNLGEDFLLYPSGKVKGSSKEQIGGTSGLYKILQETKNVDIVLVRTTGLWGSRFSRAYSAKTPPVGETFWEGIKLTFKNFLFFNPRRKVTLTFERLPREFPLHGTKVEINQALEEWYNEVPDSLLQVPYNRFGKGPKWPLEMRNPQKENKSFNPVPPFVKQRVYTKLSELTDIPVSSINEEMSLSTDLGIDSLDTAEISLFLEEAFDVRDVSGEELITVRDILSFATKDLIPSPVEEKPHDLARWTKSFPKKRSTFPKGDSMLEVFLKKASEMPNKPIIGDLIAGVLTYRDVKMRVILLAEIFKKLPGQNIGIVLPGSVAAFIMILACQAAKKTPVMINWTLGSRHIEAVVEGTKMEAAITSWAFLDRLSNVDFGSLTEKMIQLEDVRHQFTWREKLRATIQSYRSPKFLMKKWGVGKKTRNERAVILFTSGSEGQPKGVPLTHHNILSNIDSVNRSFSLYEDDVMMSILPPFHSYGFTVSSFAAPFLGLRTAFYPNPNEAHKIAKGVQLFEGTLLCGAPIFLKRILKTAKKDQMKSLRLLVTGAEKAPPELFELASNFGLGDCVVEGYGITECSPVLTLNRDGEEKKGVGRAVDDVELMIIHPETHEPLGDDQSGLILARGPNIFSGYLNPVTSPFITLNEKTWYITGDLGSLDSQGRLSITGRLKRFVKVGGEMLSLASLEEALIDFFPKTTSEDEGPHFAVVAKEVSGDRPKIILFSTPSLTLDEANKVLKKEGFSNLARFTLVYQLPEIPVLGTGKVDYKKLEGEFLQ